VTTAGNVGFFTQASGQGVICSVHGCPGGIMDVASFLKKIGDVLSERRTSARDLDALEFAADGRDVSIRVRSKPHGSLYPPLADILASIGRTCHDQGVALPQLSRIAFLSDEVRVELGDASQHPEKVYHFPIEGVLGAPTPEHSPLQMVAARLARTGD
jgi:hypothetical protein